MPSLLVLLCGMMSIISAFGSLTPVYMAISPALQAQETHNNVTTSSTYSRTLKHQRSAALMTHDDQQTGRIEIHWQFGTEDLPCDGGCGTIPCICPTPKDYLWFDWYANGASDPTCSDFMDITVDTLNNQINGKMYYSQNCDIYAIFDGPNPNEGAVQTYGSGHGVNCGWVTSWDHTSNPGILGFAEDFYFHCSW